MHLRVGGHLDLEGVSVGLADKAHQFIGVVEVARSRGAHGGGRQVAAQGHDALDARLPVATEQFGDVGARGPYTGEMRRGLHTGVVRHRHQRIVSAFLRGATGAICDGEVVRPHRRELADNGRQLGHAFRRTRGEQLERET